MTYKLSIIQTSTLKWIFVGKVPFDLGYVPKDGMTPITPESIYNDNLLPASYRKFKDRVFSTRELAVQAALELGYQVD